MDTKILRLDEITVDPALNPRIGALDQETVLDYAAHVDDLPSMTVFDGRAWPEQPGIYLVGGFHRFAAHQFAGRDVAKFIVRQGSREAAHEAADLDNLTHGLHLTRAERRGVVRRYLKRHPERSDVWVAKECRTTDKTVRSVREELEAASEIPRLDKFIGVDGIERPRSIERPPRQEPQAEAEKLMTPLAETATPGTQAEAAIERAKAEEQEAKVSDFASLSLFTAQACPDCGDTEFYWSSPETVDCATCGRQWDKLAWMRRRAFAGLEARVAAIESEFKELPSNPQPAEDSQAEASPTVGAQASEPAADEPEWLAEEGEAEPVTQAEPPAAKTDWSQPVREFKSTAPPAPKPAPPPVAPPPPLPAKPALPPPPPPVIGRAPLGITVTVYPNGKALLTAAASSNFQRNLNGPGVEMAAHVERMIEIYLREEAVKQEEPINDNAV
jgi:ribosomal protein S27E